MTHPAAFKMLAASSRAVEVVALVVVL